ncbi:MAG TPA: DUF2076 domain-containing protein [Bryobacteraceae bacterium]
MTPDERKMLLDLAAKIAQTPSQPRDPEAEEIIRTRIGSRPDALYLMTQTVLIQNLALQRAQQQIQELQSRPLPPQAPGSSWLGQPAQPAYTPPSQAAPQYAPPAPGFGGAGGFLRGAAQVATGVAAGTLAAQAIGSIFSHPGGGFFGGNEFTGAGMAPSEQIVNNYYDTPTVQDAELAPDDNIQYDDNAQLDDNTQFDDANLDIDDGSSFDTGSDDTFV